MSATGSAAATEVKVSKEAGAGEVKAGAESVLSAFNRAEVEEVRAQARAGGLHAVIQRAFKFHDDFNAATTRAVQTKLAEIAKLARESEEDPEKARLAILNRAKIALVQFKQLNEVMGALVKKLNDPINKNRPGGNPYEWVKNFSYPFKTHKMVEVLEGAINLLENRTHFDALSEGRIPPKYDCTSGRTTVLGDETDGLGNSRATYLKAAIAIMLKHFKKSRNQEDLDSSPMANAWSMPAEMDLRRPFAEQHRMSEELIREAVECGVPIPAFVDGDFVVTSSRGVGMETIHSGFAMGGGHFSDPLSPADKPFVPFDCTKGISVVNEYAGPVTTVDQTYLTRLRLRGWAAQFKDPDAQRAVRTWEESAPEPKILEQCALVTRWEEATRSYITDPDKIKPGDTGFYREFADADPDMLELGKSGHAWVVASPVKPDGKSLGSNWNRSMPSGADMRLGKGGTEGVGVSEFQVVDRKGRIQGFFRPKKA